MQADATASPTEEAFGMRAIITSVKCGDFLAATLPAWKAIIPAGCLGVATSPTDTETQDVCAAHDVPAFITDAWSRIDSTCHSGANPPQFNMALGLDEAFGFLPGLRAAPADGELCLSLNADVYPFGKLPKASDIQTGTMAGWWRHECHTPKDLAAHVHGTRPISAYKRMKNSGGRPVGYAQLFRYFPGFRFGSYGSAAKYDVTVFAKFARLEMRTDLYLFHLGGPEGGHANWVGRCVPRWDAA
jgi:hypothetical protein